jgi:hypothetical protein
MIKVGQALSLQRARKPRPYSRLQINYENGLNATMEKLPDSTIINGEEFYFEKILKRDFFSINLLYKNKNEVRYCPETL